MEGNRRLYRGLVYVRGRGPKKPSRHHNLCNCTGKFPDHLKGSGMSGKFPGHLESLWIIFGKFPDVWKVARWSGMFPDNLESLSSKFLDCL